ncbi:MAG: peptide MFS transporter [Bacteroidetes bacterium]|nr:peptide MFS transporter [Bacteroidota bacterium]MBU1579026.1 peptide MFS transporter [Bacteroidota bacterium]MBU2466908.1 peptide MFS transporter [Bacteroidota bacterium]MBU2559063.1 peptide MFS transporter [Bacteroidota bacterium]
MFKGHPKGLIIAFFANMGERFGFYTMMGILVFYLTAKYGLTESNAGVVYSVFYALIYGLALVGGIVADRTMNYKGTIYVGLITMLAGYVLMTIPGFGLVFTLVALFVIAFGNGLFKGNLQAVVGQMYDDPKYAHLRDSAFSVFYMGINIGALFAPSVAAGIINWFIKSEGYLRNNELPGLIHKYQDGILGDTTPLQVLASEVSGASVSLDQLPAFSENYLAAYSAGFNYAFGAAALTMIISFVVFVLFKNKLPDVKKKIAKEGEKIIEMSAAETKQRLTALFLVFGVVIFFWMAFHQNGLTMNFFARDYTETAVGPGTYLIFNIWSLLSIIIGIFGLSALLNRKSSAKSKLIGAAVAFLAAIGVYYFYTNNAATNPISPEIFQHFNPAMIVLLTPIIVGLFAWLNRRKIEPSAPRKIGIGMIITAIGFVILLVGSIGLDPFKELMPDSPRVSSYYLISTYLTLTVAELFLSPMGISFVSKVSPPKYQGLMQGGWLGATALGNQMLWVGSYLYERVAIWQVWSIFIVLSLIAAIFIFSIMKKLEKVS